MNSHIANKVVTLYCYKKTQVIFQMVNMQVKTSIGLVGAAVAVGVAYFLRRRKTDSATAGYVPQASNDPREAMERAWVSIGAEYKPPGRTSITDYDPIREAMVRGFSNDKEIRH